MSAYAHILPEGPGRNDQNERELIGGIDDIDANSWLPS